MEFKTYSNCMYFPNHHLKNPFPDHYYKQSIKDPSRVRSCLLLRDTMAHFILSRTELLGTDTDGGSSSLKECNKQKPHKDYSFI